jgi:hypothetical protein
MNDEARGMSEESFQGFLGDAIQEYAAEVDSLLRPSVCTYADAGVLTNNRGLVVRIGEAEFQVTIVRRR